jgi:phosphoserine aminotransferase
MLCLEDYFDALDWVESVGGLAGTIARSDANAAVLSDWVAKTPWVDFLARLPETRSNTSICLRIVDSARINAATIMPAYHRTEGLVRVAPAWRGKPVLSPEQIEDVVAYLTTLKD